VVFIYAPNGTEMKSQDFYAFQLPPSAVSSDGNLALDFLASVQPLVALLSLLVAYARYGKDRSLRTLESVLWRPVTRSGLILVRLASALIVLVAGIALLVGAVDIAALLTFGSGFPVGVFLGILGVLTAEATAFVGLAFLGAHLLRSRGSLVGFVVGVFLFFLVIFPGVVTTLMLALQLSPGSSPSLQFQLNASYFDPIQLLHSAMIALVPGWFSLGSSFGPVGPGIASVVVSIPALVLSSAAWSGAPSIAAFYLARFRD
jgi:ABC-type transport system involved in multi-copper enzyme maturation permease subunit